MRRKYRSVLWIIIGILLCTGCAKNDRKEAGDHSYVYYVNAKGTSLVRTTWDSAEGKGSTKEKVEKAMKLLASPPDNTYKSAVPDGVEAEVEEVQQGRVDLSFNEAYNQMQKKDEVLLKAAVVQTLVQIEGVSRVGFNVGNEPIKNDDGTAVGYMTADDFVQNIGSALNSYQKAELNLYFANKKGNALVEQTVNVRYNSNTSFEKLIVEQLLKGPKEDSCLQTLPPNAVLLGISVKAGICYVNFDEGFLAQGYNKVDPEVVIYSLVNSLTESDSVREVQISVNGESDVLLGNSIDLSKPFSRNMEIVEEIK